MNNQPKFKPYIPSDKKLPETTFKAIVLGILLSALLSGANAYFGLFAGMTVSASIPAAVISMAILKLFKKHNILENNAVQTAASAGESLAAGVIFTFPALVLMGYWERFNYWETVFISLSGGALGVLFTIPLRNALIVKQKLKFPEGIATSEVLKSGEKGDASTKYLIWGAILGAIIKLSDTGFKLWHSVLDLAVFVKNKAYLYFGMNLSPALVGVGYIIGVNISLLVFLGGAISWFVAIPIYLSMHGNPDGMSAVDLGYHTWSTQIRYLGVGGMVVGGLWALINLGSSIVVAFKEGVNAFKRTGTKKINIRTESDIPMKWVIIGIISLVIPVFIIYLKEIEMIAISGLMSVFMVVAGFLFSAVAAYMAGLVGSSNNPISGVTIATILLSSLVLLFILGSGADKGPAAAIMIGSIVCCAAAIGGDNMQDLKSGHLLGATPKKQQIMQIIGVVSAALILPVILNLILEAFGFGPKTDLNPDSLAAPQATLMQSVATGVFHGGLPWDMVFIGMTIGIAIIITDKILETRKSSFRMPVLAVAIGIYLPFELDSAIMLGGLIAWLVSLYQKRLTLKKQTVHNANKAGLLFASGLITGEALMGIIIAIPIAVFGPDVLNIFKTDIGQLPGVLILTLICVILFKIVTRILKKDS